MEITIFFRALKSTDAEFINELRSNEQMENNLAGVKRFVSLEREAKWVNDLIMNDNQSIIYLAVCEKGSEEIIGYTSISDIDYRNGSCFWSGIKMAPEKSGKGYGFQVEMLVLKYVFEELRMVRCIAQGQEGHEPALRLMAKAGFQKEGLMRKFVFKNGKHINTWLLSILEEEYLLKKKELNF